MTTADPAFESLLEYLRDSRGFDFTGYKRSSLVRRVGHRMEALGIADYADYIDRLEVQADEFTALFNTILINVTGFFRDPDAWQALREGVLPALIEDKAPGRPIRVWSAGCASGEEAYSLAMALAELMGVEEFRSRVKVYATDVDHEALTQARHGSYGDREVTGVPGELLDRYFESVGDRHVFRRDLRRSVIFGRNDLVQDAPISRIDLLLCRNTLMYFTAETQARILARFHFALADSGVLVLGKAERLLSHNALFSALDPRRRTFRKAARANPIETGHLDGVLPLARRAEPARFHDVRAEAALAAPMPQVVVTADGIVALVNRRAELEFGVSPKDVGRPFRDLDLSYRPVELRHVSEQAAAERRAVDIRDVPYHRGAQTTYYDVQVNPLVGPGGTLRGTAVTFVDVTDHRRLRHELEQANRQLETAYEELQSTNEELETTNEELQSTVEELETTNEELQSTNEELETMNEELQATNDDLQNMNDELHDRTGQVDRANSFLGTILAGLRAGVVVLDPNLQVQVWNNQAQELWGLRTEEVVGQHLLNLDIGLPVDPLRPLLRRVLSGEEPAAETTLPAVNRRGRRIDVRVLVGPLPDGDTIVGAVVTMEEALVAVISD